VSRGSRMPCRQIVAGIVETNVSCQLPVQGKRGTKVIVSANSKPC
jgi:hypothetical protein